MVSSGVGARIGDADGREDTPPRGHDARAHTLPRRRRGDGVTGGRWGRWEAIWAWRAWGAWGAWGACGNASALRAPSTRAMCAPHLPQVAKKLAAGPDVPHERRKARRELGGARAGGGEGGGLLAARMGELGDLGEHRRHQLRQRVLRQRRRRQKLLA